MRVDDLQSSVTQLTVQILESQDRANSLSYSRDFHDPEKASSSRLPHVPSHPLTLPSFFEKGLAAILSRSLTHGSHLVHRETFLKIHQRQMNRQLVPEMCMQESYSYTQAHMRQFLINLVYFALFYMTTMILRSPTFRS